MLEAVLGGVSSDSEDGEAAVADFASTQSQEEADDIDALVDKFMSRAAQAECNMKREELPDPQVPQIVERSPAPADEAAVPELLEAHPPPVA